MKFYLKTWFIFLLVIVAGGLAITVIILSKVIGEFDFFAAAGNFGAIEEKQKNDRAIGFKEGSPTRGNPKAKITVVEFSDFQCPFCKESFGILREIFQKFPDEMYFQYRHFPLEGADGSHPLAREAAEASMCANAQGKFWEYHDLIFQNQNRLTIDSFFPFASALQLDTTEFAVCFQTRKFADLVAQDFEDARILGVKATPTFFVNGVKIEGTLPLSTWEQLIKELG